MQSLREYMQTNSWIAVTAGCSVDDALDSLQRAGCVLDSPECLNAWERCAFSSEDLAKVVRAKLVSARSGQTIWTSQRSYPGTVDHAPNTPLVSGRQDPEAVSIRVRALFVSDRKSIQEIAKIENLSEEQVRKLCRGTRAPKKMPTGKAMDYSKLMDARTSTADEATEKAERAERLRAFYRLFGRQPPSRVVGA